MEFDFLFLDFLELDFELLLDLEFLFFLFNFSISLLVETNSFSPCLLSRSLLLTDLKIFTETYGFLTGPKIEYTLPIFCLSLVKTKAPAGGVLVVLTISFPELARCEMFPRNFIKSP